MNNFIHFKVIEIFNKYRKNFSDKFEPSQFLDFLLVNYTHSGDFRKSFLGLHRFNNFLDEIQMFFGICFSIKDREANYSLDKFCERIEYLIESLRSSKASFRNRSNSHFDFNFFTIVNLLFILFILAIFENFLFLTFVLIVFFIINYFFIESYFKEKKYIKELYLKIYNNESTKKPH
jgi:hypothetical protein